MLFFSSCKKEHVDYPYNDIEQFTITDAAGNKLKGSISGDTIKVYWPPFQTKPDSINPQISLSERASISPASGKKVSFTEGTTYTVTAQNGVTRVFKLKPMINLPSPVFEVESPASLVIGSLLRLNGQYFIPDTVQTKLYLTGTNKKDVPVSLKNAAQFMSIIIGTTIPMDGSIDTGFYSVKLVTGTNTAIKGPYHIGIPAQSSFGAAYTFNEAGKSLLRSTEISFSYVMPAIGLKYYGGKFTRAEIRVVPTGSTVAVLYNLAVSTQTNGLAKFMLPANILAGNINRIRVYVENPTTTYLMYTWTTSATTVTTVAP